MVGRADLSPPQNQPQYEKRRLEGKPPYRRLLFKLQFIVQVKPMNKTIYALGFFDGVHIGHGALLRACCAMAQRYGCSAGVVTFDTHPEALVKGAAPALINSPADRERLLRQNFPIQQVVTLPFDDSLRSMPWRSFLDMLVQDYGGAGFVCGEDFRFGYRGQGNAQMLRSYCGERGMPFEEIPEQLLEGIRVSSTYIRRQIETGDMATAVRFLGHPHILTGTVVPGKQLGRKLGIPTANLHLPQGLVVPKFGVYACRVKLDGVYYPAVTNIGTRPTVSGSGITVEPWILDYSGDLYNREITLEFFRFLRPEEKFPTLDALKQEIQKNALQTRELLEKQGQGFKER